VSIDDLKILKRKEVEYCVEGYQSFRAVEHSGLKELLQTCVDFGARYGKFDIGETLAKRSAVSRETVRMAADVKKQLAEVLKEPIEDGSVSLCLDLYTDDYRKKAYLDVHATWVARDFTMKHAALAVRHFGTIAHTAENILAAVSGILREFGLSEHDTPVTTDHGSNVVAALRNSVRLDCVCHRLHTVLDTAWRDTKNDEPEAATYETSVSDLCRYVKQATGLQEQLPMSLKHGGDTRPWVSMCRRAESVECSYEALVKLLTARDRLETVANVNRTLNREVLDITKSAKQVFEALQGINTPTLQLVAPSYYLLRKQLQANPRETKPSAKFRQNMAKYLDNKFWTSIKALQAFLIRRSRTWLSFLKRRHKI
jgi:hypothetical protein